MKQKFYFLSYFFLFSPLQLQANVVGTDLQNFNASPSGIDYVTVHSAETLEPGYINLGLMSNYSVNSLPVFSDENETQNHLKINDTLLTSELLGAYGVSSGLEIGFALGVLLKQTVDHNDASKGFYKGQGLTNTRIQGKYNLWQKNDQGIALIASINFNHIKKNPYLGSKNSPIYHLEMAYEKKWLGFNNAINLGYRWREVGEQIPSSMIEPTKNQLLLSIASNYLLTSLDTKIICEIFGSRPSGKRNSDSSSRQASSLEGLVGLKHDLSTNIALHIGGATEMLHGVASPDYRVYAGINVTFAPPEPRVVEKTGSPPTAITPEYISPTEEKFILYSIHFDSGSADLSRPEAIRAVEAFVVYLKSLSSFQRLIISGHTDSIGSASFNQKLSLERAEGIKTYLAEKHGFDPKIMEAQGLGETEPIADNGNFQGRLKNRRVEIRVVKTSMLLP